MATLFCFTSTGNSLYVARKIAEQTDGKVVPMNNASLNSRTVCDDDVIGFVYPVFFWGLPRVADRFISELQINNKDAYIFAVATYGGAAPGVNGRIGNLMKSKGARLSYGVNLKCVENYIPYYKANDSEEFRQRIEAKISEIITAIKGRASNRIQAFTIINKFMYSF
jgi:flavodoxin